VLIAEIILKLVKKNRNFDTYTKIYVALIVAVEKTTSCLNRKLSKNTS
jgi:hypothetical protein